MPKIVNFDEKKDYICLKAYEEFIENGVNNFSLNKFIHSINMSKGQFYHYFKTKEELIFEVIDRKGSELFEDIEVKINKATTFNDKLIAFFSFYLDLSTPDNKPFDKLMKDTFYMFLNVENQFIKQKNIEFYNLIFKLIDEIFTDMISKKHIKEDSKKIIPSLVATADGMYLQSIILENYDLKKNLTDYIEMLDNWLKK